MVRWSKPIEAKNTHHQQATTIDVEKLTADVEKYPNAYQSEQAERFGEGNILEMNNILLLDW